jgi:hypothetical protein
LAHFFSLALPLLADEGVIIALKGGTAATGELQVWQYRGPGHAGDPEKVERRFSTTLKRFRLPILKSNRSLVVLRQIDRKTI